MVRAGQVSGWTTLCLRREIAERSALPGAFWNGEMRDVDVGMR
jgi:hypothetical protein